MGWCVGQPVTETTGPGHLGSEAGAALSRRAKVVPCPLPLFPSPSLLTLLWSSVPLTVAALSSQFHRGDSTIRGTYPLGQGNLTLKWQPLEIRVSNHGVIVHLLTLSVRYVNSCGQGSCLSCSCSLQDSQCQGQRLTLERHPLNVSEMKKY